LGLGRAKIIVDELEILDILTEIKEVREKLWIWQKGTDKVERRVHFGFIRSLNLVQNFLDIKAPVGTKFKFAEKGDIYIFSKEESMAFKAAIRNSGPDFISISFPTKLNQLTSEELKNIQIIEKEQEEKFSHLRGTPRTQVEEDQTIHLKRIDGKHMGEEDDYTLFDISTGGMAFLVFDPGDFIKNEKLVVTMMNGKSLPKHLRGKVVSIRKVDDQEDQFKVGVQFTNL